MQTTNLSDRMAKALPLYGKTVETRYGLASVVLAVYFSGRLAISLVDEEDGEPIATLTVNDPETTLRADEILVKTWSENEEIAKVMAATGWFEDTGRRVQLNHVTAQVWRTL